MFVFLWFFIKLGWHIFSLHMNAAFTENLDEDNILSKVLNGHTNNLTQEIWRNLTQEIWKEVDNREVFDNNLMIYI